MKNIITSAGTEAQQRTEDEVTTSSPNNGNTTVGCCTSVGELIQWCILNAFNIEGQDGTKYVAIDYEEMQSQLDYFVKKEKDQLVDAFDNGQANWDAKCQDYKNGTEYFNNTFIK